MIHKMKISFMNSKKVELNNIDQWYYTSEATHPGEPPRLIVIPHPGKDRAQRVEYPVTNIRKIAVFVKDDNDLSI